MALTHRKLFKDPFFDPTQLCQAHCDATINTKGLCPPVCFSICNSSCKISLPDIILFPSPTPPPPPPLSHHQLEISTRFLIFIVSLVTFFAILLCFVLYKCCKTCRNRARSRRLRREARVQTEDTHQDFLDEDHGFVLDHPIWYIRTIGLQPSVISAITICKYKKGEGLVEGTECSVCLSEFQENETLRLLPKCNHAFHIPCIDTWLRSHTNCPLCRAGIVSTVAVLPAQEQRIDESNGLEDAQVGGLGDNGSESESERGNLEFRGCSGVEGEPRVESERKGDLGNLDQLEVNKVILPTRRSVSMDFSSVKAGEMGFVLKSVLDANQGKLASCSSEKSEQKEPSSMQRSFSFSGKVLLARHNNCQSRS